MNEAWRRSPELTCDIVMKGGITSGVVYPRVISELAKKYQFVNVGGTSVGAIAAAAAAAAEHGRKPTGGESFARLHELPTKLAEPVGGALSRLLGFFQPEPTTRRLFEIGVAFAGRRTFVAIGGLAAALWRGLVPPAILVVTALALGSAGQVAWPWVTCALLGALLLAAIGVVGEVAHFAAGALCALAGNYFGMCRLGPLNGDDDDERPLTVWLHRMLRRLAGLGEEDGPPLTFGDLWGAKPEADWDTSARELNLELISTDLSRSRSLRLPVPTSQFAPAQPVAADDLVFERGELATFFPANVIKHLWEQGNPIPDGDLELLRAEAPNGQFRTLTLGRNLPVVVAARMSLSFPILISALPLWRVDRRKDHKPRAQRVWISDGGITSNFPVHFFDSALPRRPTFGVTLPPTDPERLYAIPEDYVVPPDDPADPADDGERDVARPMTDVAGFFVAIKDAMQNWHDNEQRNLPGFADRVVGIAIGPKEGGLNLTMDAKKIKPMGDRGQAAADLLTQLFTTPPRWDDHRFRRYRVAMALVDRFFRRYQEAWNETPKGGTLPYPERVARGPFPSAGAATHSRETAEGFVAQVCVWRRDSLDLDDSDVTRPLPDLRIAPPT